MPQYKTLKPVVVDQVHDGEVVGTKHYPRAGIVVELTDKEARPLLDAGRIEPTNDADEPGGSVTPVPQPSPPGDANAPVAAPEKARPRRGGNDD